MSLLFRKQFFHSTYDRFERDFRITSNSHLNKIHPRREQPLPNPNPSNFKLFREENIFTIGGGVNGTANLRSLKLALSASALLSIQQKC